MSSKMKFVVAMTFALLATRCAPVAAQGPAKMTKQEQANLKFVLNWWRVFISGHAELFPQYLAPDVIQHNPNEGPGIAVIQGLVSRRKPVDPIPDKLTPEQMPVLALSNDDVVVLVWDRQAKDPADPSKTYHYNAFDAFRVKNGKITEHWDNAMKNPPANAGRAQ